LICIAGDEGSVAFGAAGALGAVEDFGPVAGKEGVAGFGAAEAAFVDPTVVGASKTAGKILDRNVFAPLLDNGGDDFART
jgi:hypothetical protein